jgi:hypothetical protein
VESILPNACDKEWGCGVGAVTEQLVKLLGIHGWKVCLLKDWPHNFMGAMQNDGTGLY